MKKFKFILAFLLAVSITTAQDYEIMFTASGETSTVVTVEVENLTKGTSLTLGGFDILHLLAPSGIESITNNNNNNLKIYPNPVKDISRLEFYNSKTGNVTIEIFDISGKKVFGTTNKLLKGTHTYLIDGLKTGIYLIRVISPDYNYKSRIISLGGNSSGANIIYYESSDSEIEEKNILKGNKNIVEMEYNDGDVILLKGISGLYSRIVTLVPTESQTVNFEFILCYDADGYNYTVVTIGSQTWMAENLRYLPSVSAPNVGSNINPVYYVFGNQSTSVETAKATSNYQTYGVLYNLPAATVSCPVGWHLPSDAEWTELTDYLITNGYNYDGTTEGNKMAKSMAATTLWLTHGNEGAIGNDLTENNKSGFSALPGGLRNSGNNFIQLESDGSWWSATESDEPGKYWRRIMRYYGSTVDRYYYDAEFGFSVRCVKN